MFEQTNSVMSSGTGMVSAPASVAAIADAVQKSQGVINLSNGVVYDIFTIPTSFAVTQTSNAAGGGASITQYIFNTSVLNAAVTTNGSGAASAATTYGDGFVGRIYDQYLKSANNGRGIKMLGFTVVATNYTSGDQTSVPFTGLNMNLLAANGQGSVIPIPFDLSEAVRNTQYQVGTLTVKKEFFINSLCQLSYILPTNTIMSWTFFTEASGFKG